MRIASDLAPVAEPVVKRQLPIKKDSNSIETSKRLRHYHQRKGRRGTDKVKSGDGRIKEFRKIAQRLAVLALNGIPKHFCGMKIQVLPNIRPLNVIPHQTLRFTNCEYVHQLQSERDTAGEAYSFAGAAPFAPAKLCAHGAVIF